MFDIEQEYAAGPEGGEYLPVDVVQVGEVVQGQIGNHQVIVSGGIAVFGNAAYLIPDAGVGIARPGFGDHLLTEIQSQGFRGALFHGVFAVPAIAAAQIQYPAALHGREQRLELMPFPGSFQSAGAPGHPGIGVKKCLVIIDVVHGKNSSFYG